MSIDIIPAPQRSGVRIRAERSMCKEHGILIVLYRYQIGRISQIIRNFKTK